MARTRSRSTSAPTIWPFGFAIAALIIALGLIVSSWLLIPGAVFVVVCAVGWFRDVARSHTPSER